MIIEEIIMRKLSKNEKNCLGAIAAVIALYIIAKNKGA